jgi:hypothetical protein
MTDIFNTPVKEVVNSIFQNIGCFLSEFKKIWLPLILALTFGITLLASKYFIIELGKYNTAIFMLFIFCSMCVFVNSLVYIKPMLLKIMRFMECRIIVLKIKFLKNEEKWILAAEYGLRYNHLFKNPILSSTLYYEKDALSYLVSLYKKGIFLEMNEGLYSLNSMREDIREYLILTNGKDLACKNNREEQLMYDFLNKNSNLQEIIDSYKRTSNELRQSIKSVFLSEPYFESK